MRNSTRRTRRFLALVALVSASLLATPGPTMAAPPTRTYGAAVAALRAGLTGGVTIITHNPNAHGVPAQQIPTGSREDLRIYPLVDDASYCASGWHLLALAYYDELRYYSDRQELFDYLAAVDIGFVLDGAALTTTSTAIEPIPNYVVPDQVAYGIVVGTLLAPGSLTEGQHELTVTVDDPIYGSGQFTVRFFVLPC